MSWSRRKHHVRSWLGLSRLTLHVSEFGLMHITGERNGVPVKVGVAITDLTTGLYACNSIMAALLQRVRTQRGQHLDVALSDCQTASLSNIASSVLTTGKPDSGRWGDAHPSIVPYSGFPTSDGTIMFGGGNDKLFGILCTKLGIPEAPADAKFKTNAVRVANRTELEALITSKSKTKTTEEWLQIFAGSGMPYAPINDVKKTLENEHTIARGMVQEMPHPECGMVKMVGTPVKYSDSTPGIRTPPPTLGQHTDHVLGEMLGWGAERIQALKKEGVIS